MAQVISATTKFLQRGGATTGSAKHMSFLQKAIGLLDSARGAAAEGCFADAVELSYQAGLRAAGAWVAVTTVGKRKRLPSSAWEQISLIGPEGKAWAAEFQQYSRLRSRLVTGLEDGVDAVRALALLELAARFIDMVRGEGLGEQQAA